MRVNEGNTQIIQFRSMQECDVSFEFAGISEWKHLKCTLAH